MFSSLVKIFENFRFFRKFWKISISVKFSKNFDISQIFEKFWFWSMWKITFLFKFSKKVRFCSKLSKISKNIDFSQIFDKFRFLSYFRNISAKYRKISIWVKFLKNFDLGQNFRKISISSKIPNNFDLGQIFEKLRFWSNYRKISILVKIF